MEKLREFGRRHEELKKRIHSFRIPLPPWGVNVMRAVYISIPLLVGGWVMSWAQQRASVNVGQSAVVRELDERRRKIAADKRRLRDGGSSGGVAEDTDTERELVPS